MSLGYSFKPRPHSHVLGTAGSVMTIGLSMDAHTRKTSLKGVGCFWPIFILVVISSTFKCIVSACRGWYWTTQLQLQLQQTKQYLLVLKFRLHRLRKLQRRDSARASFPPSLSRRKQKEALCTGRVVLYVNDKMQRAYSLGCTQIFIDCNK